MDEQLARLSPEQRAALEQIERLLDSIPRVPAVDKRAAFLAETRRLGLPDECCPPIEVLELNDALNAESDRGCALLAASYLESELDALLRGFFISDEKAADELLEASRPLASFSAKIDVAYCLGLVPNVSRRDFHIVRRIRNDFGHETKVTFQDQAIINRCKELRHQFDEEGISPRRRFVRAVIGLAAVIHDGMRSNARRPEAKDVDMSKAKPSPEFLKGVLDQLEKLWKRRSE
jgi:DNA-binding MltR family transcriptional regulator